MAVPLTNSHSVPYHRIDCMTVPLTFGIRQDAMLLSPVATDIRFCNLTLYNGLVGLGLNKILQHKEMMFRALRAPRGLGGLASASKGLLYKLFELGACFCRLQEV